jgi:glycosyltransferase involved in cell wall biosynthesis
VGNSLLLSVTIATYKRRGLLEKSLIALANQTLSPELFEIIVCDSLSDDGTDLMIVGVCEKYPHLKIKHVHTRNVLAAKRNLGIAESSGEVVIFLDDDCIADAEFLKGYYNLFINEARKNIIYCGEVRFPAEWISQSNYYNFRDSRHFGGARRQDLNKLDYKTIVVMNMAFYKNEFISKIGLVDENFVCYGCEDQDLGWRLESKGFIIEKSKSLIVHHEPSGDILGYSKKLFHTARDGMTTLLKRNPAAASALGLKLQLLDKDYPRQNALKKIIFGFIRRILFNDLLENIFSILLIKTDNIKIFYSPVLYKYVLACAYVRGTKARQTVLKNSDSWYE